MQSGIKYRFLWVFAWFIMPIWMAGCSKSICADCEPLYCGPHSIHFSADGTAYLLGYAQLLAVDPQGNIKFNYRYSAIIREGWFSDNIDISNNIIWEVDTHGTLTIIDLQGNSITQLTTDFSMTSSVKIAPSTDIGWIGGYTITDEASVTVVEPRLKALNVSGQTLTSFTLPQPSISSFNELNYVKLAISSSGTIWAWSPGYLSGYSFTGLVYGPYPINMVESNERYLGCVINEKWIIENPVTNDIWMGNPATTTVLALSPDGTIQFQKNLGINVSTMAVSPKTGNVWIGSGNKIEVLDPHGNVIKQLVLKNLNCITYMAISPLDDTVWVGNETNMASTDKDIFILDDNGNIVNSIYVPVKCFAPYYNYM
jgi:hypothetical protein